MFSFPNFRRADVLSSARNLRILESFDLPNTLPPSAETGNIAYFNDEIWYKSSGGWISLTPSVLPPPTSGNIVVNGNLITASGNLVINPAGTSTDFSGKNISNVNTLTVQTLNSGNIFNTGSISTPILSTQSGNLVLNPAGSAIDFSGKSIINAVFPGGSGNVTGIVSANNVDIPITNTGNSNTVITQGSSNNHLRITDGNLGNLTFTMLPGANSGFQVQLFNAQYLPNGDISRYNTLKRWWALFSDQRSTGDTFALYGGTSTSTSLATPYIQIIPELRQQVIFETGIDTNSIITSFGNLSINPAGTSVNFNNKTISSVLSLSTPTITTTSGDLSLNPAGSNVNFNGKNIINAANFPTTSSATYTLSNPNWTGTASIYVEKTANVVNFRIFANSILTCVTTSAFETNSPFTNPIFRTPLGGNARYPITITANGVGTIDARLFISGSFVTIFNSTWGDFPAGTTLDLQNNSVYGSWTTI